MSKIKVLRDSVLSEGCLSALVDNCLFKLYCHMASGGGERNKERESEKGGFFSCYKDINPNHGLP